MSEQQAPYYIPCPQCKDKEHAPHCTKCGGSGQIDSVIRKEQIDYICDDCGTVIDEDEHTRFGGKCESCNEELNQTL